jgi:hypothetical protein
MCVVMLMVQKLNMSKFLKHENKITASSDKWKFVRIFSWSIAICGDDLCYNLVPEYDAFKCFLLASLPLTLNLSTTHKKILFPIYFMIFFLSSTAIRCFKLFIFLCCFRSYN